MALTDWALLTHAFATLAMTGVIWFVQVVHYPLMARVGSDGFATYEKAHTARTTVVVAPLMLVELATAAWLAISPPVGTATIAWLGLDLLAATWLSTALLQVPCHRRLEAGFDPAVLQRLVRTNWLRTLAWTGRAIIALALLVA